MEIHRIEICNLNSLKGEFCIDFMSGQLKGQDIFAITGATGSGKSTILDAITLALYNRVPRLDGKKGDNEQKSRDPYKRLKPGDTVNTLTRGEKKGYAKVVFETAGELYRAEWLCELKNINFSGTHSLYSLKYENGVEKAVSLESGNLVHEFNADGLPKEGTVSKIVVELIGLGYDQFCKACILAQNSFANFLKADDLEKADILEKITGTSIYGRIASVIVKGYEEAVKEKKGIDDQVSGQEQLMIEEKDLPQVRAVFDNLSKERDDLMKEIGTLDKGLGWWNDLDGLTKERDDAETRKKSAEEKELEFLPDQKRLERHDKVGNGLQLLGEETGAQRDFNHAVENVERTHKRLKDNQESIDTKTEEKVQAEKLLKKKQDELDGLAWIKPIKENIALIRNEIRLLNKSVQNLRSTASGYAPERGYGKFAKKELIDTVDLLTIGLDPEWTAETVRTRLETISKERTLCENAGTLYPLMEQVLKLNAADQADKATIDSLSPLQEELGKDIPALILQINSLENEDFVIKRGLLVDGQPCELCGAIHHPYATASIFNEKIDGIRAQLDEKKEKKDGVDKEISDARNRVNFRSGQRNALNANILDLKDRIAAADDSFRIVFEMYAPDKQIHELKTKASQLSSRVEEMAATENTLSLIGLRDLLQEADSHKETLSQYLPDSWYDQWLTDEFKYSQALEGNVKYFTDLENGVAMDGRDLEKKKTAIKTLTDLIPGLENDIKTQEEIREEKKGLLDKAASALSDWIKAFNAGDENPVSREELVAQKEDKTDWKKLREAINDAENDRIKFDTLFKKADENLKEHWEKEDRPTEEKEILVERKTTYTSKLEEGPDSVVKRLEVVSGRLSTHEAAEKAIADFKAPLEAAAKKVNLWKRFYNMLGKKAGDKDGKEFRKLAQNYTLGLLLQYANKELDKFTKRYVLKKQNDSSLEIMVLDGELGERYSSSLSGGETFMVSLALALGLASISSGSVTLKNIFIDEGFGTLDSETQKTVVAALNTLRTQGKRIGLISHTSALLGDDSIYKIAVKKVDDKFSVIQMD